MCIMGLTSGVTIGLLLIVLSSLRLATAGYCSVNFPCTYTCTKADRIRYGCSFWYLFDCYKYRSVTATCSKTCYRQECCPGYQGPSCDTPVCFQSTACPNGGSCVRPDTCSCLPGFTGGPRCEDVNECATNNGGCQHDCTNIHGSFRCSCRSGYGLGIDRKTCINISECASSNGVCTCSDVTGYITCNCRQGYILNSVLKTCTDINECSVGTAGCEHFCTNTAGSFICSCQKGYSADGTSCEDINECVTGASGCSQQCNNLPGSYRCSCNDNYQLEADGKTCTAIALCSTSQNTCGQICVEEPGNFHCECHSGYSLGDDSSSCYDIDECTKMISRCSQTCTNTVGSFECSCNPGYHLSDDSRTCINIDNCVSDPCKNGGSCLDLTGHFTCTCLRGFTGPTCENDVNECLVTNGGCQYVCTNTKGSFRCSCTDGATVESDGFSCAKEGHSNTDVFERYKLPRKLLPRGCHDIVLTKCPDGKDIEVRLSSTSSWYQSNTSTATVFSTGVVFVTVNSLSLPVSLSGVTVYLSQSQFSISLGASALTPANGTVVGTYRKDDCYSLDLTQAEIFEFIHSNSFQKTIFNNVFAVLPDFLQLSDVNSSLMDVADMRTDFVYGRDMDKTTWCEGAPVIDDHLYSVFRFNTNFKLSIFGNTVNVPEPLTERQFCLIVDICQNYGGTVFLMIPESSRQLLQDLDFFKKLKDNQKVSIMPRGIGISLVKGINVQDFTTSLALWNGDQFFSYPVFPRGDVWIGGQVNYDIDVFTVTAMVDTFISVPSPGQIMTGVFVEEWNVLAHAGPVSQALLKFKLFNKDIAIPLLPFIDLQTTKIDVYMSIGGLQDRKLCGAGASTGIANPPGIYFASTFIVNPFANVPILEDWVLRGSARFYAYVTTDTTLHALPASNRIDIVDDIEHLNLTLHNIDTFLGDLHQSLSHSFLNVSSNLITDVELAVKDTKTIVLLKFGDIVQGNIENLHILMPQLWVQFVKIEKASQRFFDAIEFLVSNTKDEIVDYIKKDLHKIKDSIDTAIKKLVNQVTSIQENYSAFGLKLAIGIKILGLDLGEYDIEMSFSNDILARCSRFDAVYKLLEGQKAVRILGRISRDQRLGRFIVAKQGVGVGAAMAIESNDFIFQIHSYIQVLGFSTTADVFISRKGIHVFLEGNVWDTFLVQIDMSTTLGGQWYDLTFTLAGRFVAKARKKRQIQSKSSSFQDSYLDGLTRLANKVADEADKRISQAQEFLTKVQHGLTKAQIGLKARKLTYERLILLLT